MSHRILVVINMLKELSHPSFVCDSELCSLGFQCDECPFFDEWSLPDLINDLEKANELLIKEAL